MKVEFKSKSRPFSEVSPGECFLSHGDVWMSVRPLKGLDYISAVRLRDGDLGRFYSDDKVEPVSMKVVTEDP